ncbi:MAG TPA: hypothetical protein VMH28_26410 [Candidatus Acidoferrales bacterium]|nr:hypothetical protein [Candidatus Acidoferrales bacterium]
MIDKYFVVSHVTVEEHEQKAALNTPDGAELLKSLGGADMVPFFAFLAPSGSTIVTSDAPAKDGKKGGNIGHPYEPQEVDWFLVMLDKAAPRMTAEEKGAIEKFLRAQKQKK